MTDGGLDTRWTISTTWLDIQQASGKCYTITSNLKSHQQQHTSLVYILLRLKYYVKQKNYIALIFNTSQFHLKCELYIKPIKTLIQVFIIFTILSVFPVFDHNFSKTSCKIQITDRHIPHCVISLNLLWTKNGNTCL